MRILPEYGMWIFGQARKKNGEKKGWPETGGLFMIWPRGAKAWESRWAAKHKPQTGLVAHRGFAMPQSVRGRAQIHTFCTRGRIASRFQSVTLAPVYQKRSEFEGVKAPFGAVSTGTLCY
jgi:hypothetical protein